MPNSFQSSNFLRDYKPINRTSKSLPLRLTFKTLDLLKYRDFSRNSDGHIDFYKLNKFILFGYFNKRLIHTEEDQDFIRENLIKIDFSLADPELFMILFALVNMIRIFLELPCLLGAICAPIQDFWEQNNLRAVSLRSTKLEVVRSLATFDFPILLCSKLRWVPHVKRGEPGYEYDPETNRHDAVRMESNEMQES